jgi:hypothetical protein
VVVRQIGGLNIPRLIPTQPSIVSRWLTSDRYTAGRVCGRPLDVRSCRCPRETADERIVDVPDDALIGVNQKERTRAAGFTVGEGGISASGKGHRID